MHSHPTYKTAVLIFALSPGAAAENKPFLSWNSLAAKLTAATKKKVAATGMDFFHFTEAEQEGHTFGERYTNAISEVYARGYDAVITIGNDSPGLQSRHILEAKNAVENGGFAMGPSHDGGFYLMALQQAHFDPAAFAAFSWNTAGVGQEVLSYFRKKNAAVHTLPPLYDLDRPGDAKKLLATLKPVLTKVLRLLTMLLKPGAPLYVYHPAQTLELSGCPVWNKGSPLPIR